MLRVDSRLVGGLYIDLGALIGLSLFSNVVYLCSELTVGFLGGFILD